MSKSLVGTRKRIAVGAVAVLIILLTFPPINVERRFSGLTDGRSQLSLVFREFGGWGFIGEPSLVILDGAWRTKDPDKMTLVERFQAMRPQSLDEIRRGTRKVAFGILGLEVVVVLAVAGFLLFRSRSRA